MCQEVSEYFSVLFFFLPPSFYVRVPDGRCGWVVVARFLQGKKKFLGTELPLPSKSNRTVKAAAVDCRSDKGRQRACGMQLLCLNTSQTIKFKPLAVTDEIFFVSTFGLDRRRLARLVSIHCGSIDSNESCEAFFAAS